MLARIPHSGFFVSARDEPRVRRAGDAVVVLLGILTLFVATVQSERSGPFDRAVVDLVDSLPSWSQDAFAIGYGLSAIYALGVIGAALVGGRKRLYVTRDLVLAAAIAVGLVLILVRSIEGEWPVLLPELGGATTPQIPVARVATVTAVVVAAAPHVLRPMRRLGWAVVFIVALSGMGIGLAVATDALGSVGLGMAAGGAVMLLFGSPAAYPDRDQILAELAQLGLPVTDMEPMADQPWGARHLTAQDLDGNRLLLKVYGRDARDAQVFSKMWRYLWYRDTGPSFTLSRLQQVEHEALVSLLADRAGVATPAVLVAAKAADDSAVLVVERRGECLADIDPSAVTDEALIELWKAVGALHEASISHGSLNVEHVFLDSGSAVLGDFHNGSLSAGTDRTATDVAELAVSLAARVGVERTVRSAIAALGNSAMIAALPYVQVAAISPATRKSAGDVKDVVKALQDEISTATGTELPEPVKLRRVNVRDLVFTGLMVFAAYFLIKQIAGLDIAQIWDSMKTAEWAWVFAAFIAAQVLLVPNATGMMAAVSAPIPLKPTVILQSAIQFIGLAVPSAAGRIVTNIAYLRKFGVSSVTALTQGALDSFTGFLTQATILVLALVFGNVTFGGGGDFNLNWVLILSLVGAVILIGFVVLWFVKSLRERVLAPLREAGKALSGLFKQPQRAMALFGSNLASNVVLGIALWLTVEAYGQSIGLATAIVIVVATLLLGGMAPTPGGVGVAEATLAAGMVAAGLSQDVAFAAAITYRLVTFFLPPIWGFFSLRWLQRNDFV